MARAAHRGNVAAGGENRDLVDIAMSPAAAVSLRGSRRAWTVARRRQAIEGYLYIAPWLIGFFLLTLGPFVASIYISFTSYPILTAPKWVGLRNYVEALSGTDELFWPALAKTFYFAVVSVPLGVVGSLLVAVLLNEKLRGTTLFRTLFYMPSLVPGVGAILLWLYLLDPIYGPLNAFLQSLGIDGPLWFQSATWAIPGLIVMALWTGIGGSRMIIFLAGLQGVPEELYDAAAIDGAGAWHRFRHVTVPMLTPVIFFNTVLGIIGALHVFATAFIATQGGPAYATWFIALHIYNQAFRYFQMGYASALAWIFCVILVVLTLLQIRLARVWVYYGGDR
jgi:multiple sugar transport system permease protein